jgi:hypothetical protein
MLLGGFCPPRLHSNVRARGAAPHEHTFTRPHWHGRATMPPHPTLDIFETVSSTHAATAAASAIMRVRI